MNHLDQTHFFNIRNITFQHLNISHKFQTRNLEMNLRGRIDQEDTLIGDHVRLTFLQYIKSYLWKAGKAATPQNNSFNRVLQKSCQSIQGHFTCCYYKDCVTHPTWPSNTVPTSKPFKNCVEGCKKEHCQAYKRQNNGHKC